MTYEEYCVFRDQKGLKDSKVAEKAGIGASTFSDWKSGRSLPKQGKLRKIAEALDMSIEQFMGWDIPVPEESAQYLKGMAEIDLASAHKEALDVDVARIGKKYCMLTEDQQEVIEKLIDLFLQ